MAKGIAGGVVCVARPLTAADPAANIFAITVAIHDKQTNFFQTNRSGATGIFYLNSPVRRAVADEEIRKRPVRI